MTTLSPVRMVRGTFSTSVAGNVRAEMARWGVTQRDLAQVLQLSQARISDRSRGETPWGLDELEAIAPLLRTTASALCAIRDSNPEPADWESEGADVVDLASVRAARSDRFALAAAEAVSA